MLLNKKKGEVSISTLMTIGGIVLSGVIGFFSSQILTNNRIGVIETKIEVIHNIVLNDKDDRVEIKERLENVQDATERRIMILDEKLDTLLRTYGFNPSVIEGRVDKIASTTHDAQ